MIEILYLPHDREAIFLERINRFTGMVKIDDEVKEAHIHDTGRLSELLYKGNRILLKKANNERRKTEWDIIASYFDGDWILTNSSYHSEIFAKTLEKVPYFAEKGFKILREVKFGSSRLDFKLINNEKEILVEVKGCTLRNGYEALFPDAPTKRGTRHVDELMEAVKTGYDAWLVFVIMHRKAKCFRPNAERDFTFSQRLKKALVNGVKVIPLKYHYDGKAVYFLEKIPMCKG